MLYTTTIPVGGAEEQELRAIAESLSKIAGKTISIDLQFVICTESLEITTMFDALKDSILARESVRANGHKNGHKKPAKAKKAKKAPEMGPRSWKNVLTGEILSGRVLNGLVSEQTAFENRKGEVFVYIGGEMVKEPQGDKA